MVHRSFRLILAGLICLGVGAAGLWLAWRSSDTTAVWVATARIQAGQVLGAGDVTAVRVTLGPGVQAVPATQTVTGLMAVTDIEAGAMLAPAAVQAPSGGQSGLVHMAVVVEVGSAPVSIMRAGTAITLLGPAGDPVSGTVASSPVLMPDTARHSFDVLVSLADAPRLAQWVAEGTVVIAAA
jgi:hypothetical protein